MKKYTFIIILFLLTGTGYINAQCYRTLLTSAEKEYSAGNYEKAIEIFTKACSGCSDMINCNEANNGIARCNKKLQDIKNKKCYDDEMQQAFAAFENKQFSVSSVFFNEAINCGWSEGKKNAQNWMKKCSDSIAAINKCYDDNFATGKILFQKNDFTGAKERFIQAIACSRLQDNSEIESWLNICNDSVARHCLNSNITEGKKFLAQQDYNSAKKYFEYALVCGWQPGMAEADALLARCNETIKMELAKQCYNTNFALGSKYSETNDLANAKSYYQKAIDCGWQPGMAEASGKLAKINETLSKQCFNEKFAYGKQAFENKKYSVAEYNFQKAKECRYSNAVEDIDKWLARTREKIIESREQKRYDYYLGIGSFGYSFAGYRGFNATLFNNWFSFGNQRVVGLSFPLAKYKRLPPLHYTLTNWGDHFTNYDYSFEPSYIDDPGKFFWTSLGDYSSSGHFFALLVPTLQIYLLNFPKKPMGFDFKHFTVSAYLETYPFDFVPVKLNFPYYYNHDKYDKDIRRTGETSYLWNFFNGFETGLKIQNSFIYINAGYFFHNFRKMKFSLNRAQTMEKDFGGKAFTASNISFFFVQIGITADWFRIYEKNQ